MICTHYTSLFANSQPFGTLLTGSLYIWSVSGKIIPVILMIKMRVQEILDQKKKTRYWLVKEMQTTYKTVNKICDNTLTDLQLETIEKLCSILDCMPNDLFEIE